jgi:alpha-beta hydrolase superfamily lysophospholipase
VLAAGLIALACAGCQPAASAAVDPAQIQPQRVDITAEDGVKLVGTYYPPAASPAPAVILIHMLGGSKGDWAEFAVRLQNSGYAALAIDLRGHGESAGNGDAMDTLVDDMARDGQAALAYARTIPAIEPDRIVIVGASVGADITLLACNADCAGVALISPGEMLIPGGYVQRIAALGKPVLCAASQSDAGAAHICAQASHQEIAGFTLQLYSGKEQGTQMFQNAQTPPLSEVLIQWLTQVFP